MSLPADTEKKLDGWLLELGFAAQSGLSTLEELREILRRVRYESGVDANELLGLKKNIGGQSPNDQQRLWTIVLCWIAAMRGLDDRERKAGIASYIDYLEGIGVGGLVVSDKALEKRWKGFKDTGETTRFTLHGGIRTDDEERVVRYLEPQGEAALPTLWRRDVKIITEPTHEDPYLFCWSLKKPRGDWTEVQLQWTEKDDGLDY